MSSTNLERIVWLDVLKGILLLFICLSHFESLPSFIKPVINLTASYWVPMFFILSGYLYNPRKQKLFKPYFISKTRSLFFPFICFGLIFIVLDWNSYLSIDAFTGNFMNICFRGLGPAKAAPLWFVFVLYLTVISSYFVLKLMSQRILLLSIMLLLSLISYYFSIHHIILPYMLHILPSAIIFFVSGILVRFIVTSISSMSGKITLSLFAAGGGILGFFINLGDFHLNIIRQYPLFYLSPFLLCLFLIIIMSRYERKIYQDFLSRLLTWIARNGIIILSVHCYLIIVYDIVVKSIMHIEVSSIPLFIIKFIFIFSALYLVIVPLCNDYLYRLIGKKKIEWMKNYRI